MDSMSPTQLWYEDEARSALARYLDQDADAVQQRRELDAHGPFHVPPKVLTAAVHHWQARLDEAEARLRDAPRAEQSGWQIEKVTALVAVNALRGLDRARADDP